MHRQLTRWIVHLEKFTDRPWYLPVVALLAALDMFILVVPTDGLLITSAMLQPKKWLRCAIWVTVGSALGALLLAAVVREFGVQFLQAIGLSAFDISQWPRTQEFVDDYGFWAIALLAGGPVPFQVAVIVGALAGMTLKSLTIAAFVGRLAKYLVFAWAATHAPRLLGGVTKIKKEVAEIEEAKKELEG